MQIPTPILVGVVGYLCFAVVQAEGKQRKEANPGVGFGQDDSGDISSSNYESADDDNERKNTDEDEEDDKRNEGDETDPGSLFSSPWTPRKQKHFYGLLRGVLTAASRSFNDLGRKYILAGERIKQLLIVYGHSY